MESQAFFKSDMILVHKYQTWLASSLSYKETVRDSRGLRYKTFFDCNCFHILKS